MREDAERMDRKNGRKKDNLLFNNSSLKAQMAAWSLHVKVESGVRILPIPSQNELEYMSPVSPIFHIVSTVNS